jgi:hypothetical protein
MVLFLSALLLIISLDMLLHYFDRRWRRPSATLSGA